MNPNAGAFVPKTRSPTSTSPNASPSASAAANSKLKAPTADSKLRAGAHAFVPRTAGSPSSANPPPPPPPNSGAPPDYTSALQHTSHPGTPNAKSVPSLPNSPMTADSLKDHKMSPEAMPYTPTRGKLASPGSNTPNSMAGSPQFPSAPAAENQAAPAAAEKDTNAASSASSRPPLFENPFADSKIKAKNPVKTAPAETLKLNSYWTLYADDHPTRPQVTIGAGAPGGSGDAAYNPVEIKAVNDMSDYWRLWRHMPAANKIPATQSFTYYWFRKDIKPSWEDPRNKDGGTLSITVYEKTSHNLLSMQAAEDAFMATMAMITGECVAKADAINGVVMKLRKQGKWQVQLWTANTDKDDHQACFDDLKKTLSTLLPADALKDVPFMPHDAAGAAAAPTAKRPKGGKPIAPKMYFKPEPTHLLS